MITAASLTYIAAIIVLSLSRYLKKTSLKAVTKLIGYSTIFLSTIIFYSTGLVDDISLTLGVFFTSISLFISLYTIRYLELNHYPSFLEILMDLFLVLIISTYIAPSFILLIVTWTMSELVGYLLIKMGEEHSVEGSLTSSRGFILTSTLTFELSVFTMLSISALFTAANIGLAELIKPFTMRSIEVSIPIYLLPLLLIGFLVKTANIPLHFWLPSAHSSAPSPASATLSGLMVSLGYYGLYRLLEYINIGQYAYYLALFLAIVGVLSIIYGGLQATVQRDSKRLLAYSTIATNGFISIIFAIYILSPGTVTKYTLILGILMHAAYKTTLFSEAGLIETIYGTRYIHGVRGLTEIAPISSIGGFISVFSLLGVPGTIGFAAKILSVYSALQVINISEMFTILALIGIAIYILLSALVGLKYSQIYYGEPIRRIEPVVAKIGKEVQVPVLAMGSLNIAWLVAIASFIIFEYMYIVLFLVPVSLLSIIVFYSYTKTRRGVGKT